MAKIKRVYKNIREGCVVVIDGKRVAYGETVELDNSESIEQAEACEYLEGVNNDGDATNA